MQVVHAQMALWVSGVVLFTLTVNAPLLGPLMNALGLNKTTPLQRKLHRCVGGHWWMRAAACCGMGAASS